MRTTSLLAGVALAALVAGSCDNAVGSRGGDGPGIAPPGGPSLSVGPTLTVQVVCPAKIQAQTSGYCWAYGVDSLGYFSGSNTNNATFSSGTPTTMAVASNGNFMAQTAGSVTVYGTVDGVTGSTLVSISPAADPSASISSPSLILPSTTCSWTASVSGGTSPITYVWSVTAGSPSGSGSGNTWTGSATGNFTLKVSVTDADGRKSSATRSVTVLPGAPAC